MHIPGSEERRDSYVAGPSRTPVGSGPRCEAARSPREVGLLSPGADVGRMRYVPFLFFLARSLVLPQVSRILIHPSFLVHSYSRLLLTLDVPNSHPPPSNPPHFPVSFPASLDSRGHLFLVEVYIFLGYHRRFPILETPAFCRRACVHATVLGRRRDVHLVRLLAVLPSPSYTAFAPTGSRGVAQPPTLLHEALHPPPLAQAQMQLRAVPSFDFCYTRARAYSCSAAMLRSNE
jgi:hypothetical protein